ncbi:MAG TPA: TIGR02996 domain-containing protein [Sandaracinaceae bacterium]
MTDARNPELEKAIYEDPDNPEAWQVYADWLATEGDPRGEIINLELAGKPSEAAALLEEHKSAWLGEELLSALEENGDSGLVTLTWERGFVRSARFATEYDAEADHEAALRALLESPAARFLRALTLGLWDAEGENFYHGAIDAITQTGPHEALRELFIGDFEYPDETEISWTEVGNVGGLWAQLPRLRVMRLQGGGIELGNLQHETLEELIVHTGGLPAEAVASISAGRAPALRKLEVWFGDENYGAGGDIDLLAGLLQGKGYPSLKHLGLMNAEFTDDIAEALPTAGILPRLETLDLSMGTMTDRGARALANNASAFKHLQRISVADNFLGEEGVAALTQAFGSAVVIGDQRQPYDWGDELRYFVSVGE